MRFWLISMIYRLILKFPIGTFIIHDFTSRFLLLTWIGLFVNYLYCVALYLHNFFVLGAWTN
jgi:hypothetical protein